MILRISLTALAMALCGAEAFSKVDETGKTLNAAKDARNEELLKVGKALAIEIDKSIKETATKGDLDAVKRLIADKEAFEKQSDYPESAELKVAVLRYKDARRKAAQALFNAYKTAVGEYTKSLLVEQASAVQSEMEDFIRDEKRTLSSGGAKADKTDIPMKAKSSHDFINELMSKFASEMEQVVSQDTKAKQDEAHRKMGQQLDDWMKTRQVTLRFPIKDVEENNEKYDLTFGPPEEIAGLIGLSYMSGLNRLTLDRKDALAIKPGDI